MGDAIPLAERLAVTLRFLATIYYIIYCVNIMLTFQLFDCFSIMFGLASAIIVYFIRISWTCAIYKEQQPSADCAGKACLFIAWTWLPREYWCTLSLLNFRQSLVTGLLS